jgi:hypothetical protein
VYISNTFTCYHIVQMEQVSETSTVPAAVELSNERSVKLQQTKAALESMLSHHMGQASNKTDFMSLKSW